jgi:ABC-type Fe3+/spermidine/putrescine transport system ATPase subunit
MAQVPPNRRKLGMVYQNYALFPHLSVRENIAFGLRMRNFSRADIAKRVARMLDLVRLGGLGDRWPRELSGGEQQRVALARAIAIEPEVLLLDEPLSNLDAKLRKRMQVELKDLQRTTGLTTIHVTHDQEEALTLADVVIILNHGQVVQTGTPREVYDQPNSVFVADFLGHANFLAGRSKSAEQGARIFTTQQGEVLISRSPTTVCDGQACKAFIRPERIGLMVAGTNPNADRAGANRLRGEVVDLVYSGSLLSVVVAIGDGRQITVERQSTDAARGLPTGASVDLLFPADALLLLPE